MTPREILDQLNSLDPRDIGGWPRWVHISAAVLVAIVMIVAGLYFGIQPDYEQLGQQQQREQSLRSEFETKQQKVAALDAYKAQLAEMERSFGDMLKQLPNKTEVANLLNDISQTRVASSLEEELFQPEGEVPKEFYAEVPNRIVVTGTYHQMGGFVSAIAALPRIVTIDSVELKPADEKSHGQLRMTAYAKTYRYFDEGEQQAAHGKPKGGN
jgi:type IV pilus assembly protein PilO